MSDEANGTNSTAMLKKNKIMPGQSKRGCDAPQLVKQAAETLMAVAALFGDSHWSRKIPKRRVINVVNSAYSALSQGKLTFIVIQR